MKPEELEQRIRQIDGFVRVLTQECHILDERRHILSPLIQDPAIQAGLKAKLDKTPGANAWNHLAPLLGQDLVRDQSRLSTPMRQPAIPLRSTGRSQGFSNACSTVTRTPRSGTVSTPNFAQRWNGSPCR